MSIYKAETDSTATIPVKENCSGCGRSLEAVRNVSAHQPEPEANESDRCLSRPRKYSHLRCMFAEPHECVHTAKVAGTGVHFWRDEAAT